MKTIQFLLLVFFVFMSAAHARIVLIEDKLYLREDGKQVPIFLVNELIKKNAVSDVKLYGGGKVHIISFAKNGEKEKLYSVDHKGFVYAIEPFADYEVADVQADSKTFQFKQAPGRRYRVNAKGFFLY